MKTAIAAPSDNPNPHDDFAAAMRRTIEARKGWLFQMYRRLTLAVNWGLRRAGGKGTLGK